MGSDQCKNVDHLGEAICIVIGGDYKLQHIRHVNLKTQKFWL